jgi:WD40 repeat protein
VNGASWNADETRILSWSNDGTVKLWDVAALLSPDADGTPLAILPHDDQVNGASWNADETRILSWGGDNYTGSVKLWDVAALLSPDADGAPLDILPHDDGVLGASWNADETRILSWSEDNTAKLWDVAALLSPDADGAPLAILPHGSFVSGATWNADETRILSWGGDNYTGSVKLWDVAALLSPDWSASLLPALPQVA